MKQSEYTVILADGDFPHGAYAVRCLNQAKRIVCCDGAADPLVRRGLIPAAIVGDLDSLTASMKERFADCVHHVREQETNDLTKAFHYCCRKGWKNLVILGATGKREDHTLGNLSLLVEYAQTAPRIRMITDHGIFFVASKSGDFDSVPGEQISIFTTDPDVFVTSTGLRYPLKNMQLKMWWQTTLNEATGTSFHLDFTEGKRLLIYRAFQKKRKVRK